VSDWTILSSCLLLPIHLDRGRPQPVNDAPIGLLSIHFTGRERELDFIRDALSKVQDSRPSCCAVHGMPGIGKSQLILHYAKMSFDRGRYSHIFWISANSIDKLNHGLAKVLVLVGHPDRYLQEQSVRLTAAQLWLESHDDWLLVFDNVDSDTLDLLRAHLPRRNAGGNILFTTRMMDVADALVNAAGHPNSILRLRVLDPRDSANLLLKDAGVAVTPSLLDHAEQLVECVGRLPLAVVHAASFMKQTRTTLDKMFELYRSKEKIEVSSYTLLYACVMSKCFLLPTGDSMGEQPEYSRGTISCDYIHQSIQPIE
jgi:hypothetical protein